MRTTAEHGENVVRAPEAPEVILLQSCDYHRLLQVTPIQHQFVYFTVCNHPKCNHKNQYDPKATRQFPAHHHTVYYVHLFNPQICVCVVLSSYCARDCDYISIGKS